MKSQAEYKEQIRRSMGSSPSCWQSLCVNSVWVGLIEDTWNVVSSVAMKVAPFHSSVPLMGYGQLLSEQPPVGGWGGGRGSTCSSLVHTLEVSVTSRGTFFCSGACEEGRRYWVLWRIFLLCVCRLAGVHTHVHHTRVHIRALTAGFQLELAL